MTVPYVAPKHERRRWTLLLLPLLLGLPGLVQADWLTGSRGPVPAQDLTFTLHAYAMPGRTCGCTAVAEVQVLGRTGGHRVAIQLGRFPGNATSSSWLRVRHTWKSGTDPVTGTPILTTESLPLGDTGALVLENYRWQALTVTVDPLDASTTLRYSDNGTWRTVTTPAVLQWPGTQSLQMQARNSHRLYSRLHLQRATLFGETVPWEYFVSGDATNPFRWWGTKTLENFTVAYQP